MSAMQYTSTKVKRIPNANFSVSVNSPNLRAASRGAVNFDQVCDTSTMRHVDAVNAASLVDIIYGKRGMCSTIQAPRYVCAETQTKHFFIWKSYNDVRIPLALRREQM
jgi:hypothetical protein